MGRPFLALDLKTLTKSPQLSWASQTLIIRNWFRIYSWRRRRRRLTPREKRNPWRQSASDWLRRGKRKRKLRRRHGSQRRKRTKMRKRNRKRNPRRRRKKRKQLRTKGHLLS